LFAYNGAWGKGTLVVGGCPDIPAHVMCVGKNGVGNSVVLLPGFVALEAKEYAEIPRF
jgi:hypothetical protein